MVTSPDRSDDRRRSQLNEVGCVHTVHAMSQYIAHRPRTSLDVGEICLVYPNRDNYIDFWHSDAFNFGATDR